MFLTCFMSFKPSFSDELAVGLFSSMVDDLQRLLKSLEENPLSLRWCSEAMSVIKKTHSHFLFDFERSKVPASWEAIHVLDEYMSVTLDLLDFCNLLKSAISGLDRYRQLINFMIKRLKDATFSMSTSKIELERLERENYHKFFDVKNLREMNLNKEVTKVKFKTRTNMQVLQSIGSTMSIISLFIFCSILHPIHVKIDEGIYTDLCNSDSSSDCVQKLINCLNEKFKNAHDLRRPVLHENEVIEDAFAEFKGQIISTREVSVDEGKLAKSLEILKNKSLVLKEGLDLLESEVNELFENVIEGRKRIISLITN
ncbi:uncharacterized protein LOC110725091 [Chenopodium quinoa]|uniref:Uncharacterized protein n=1 Tax=Chenopodium quinoa TaxID=63459 RepID=A0A803M548_CHEQI|nr:uncharacterized protein LOC110725091 [Chenopodium quinoa]